MRVMMTRILAVVAALLAALVVHQYNQIGQMRAEVAAAEQRAITRARSIAADSMEGLGAEIQRTMLWLDNYYKAPEGLQRPEGLWIKGHPDYEGIGAWIFDVYLRHRLKGESEDQARQAIETAIRGSDEWRSKHRP
jgi:hypothetical protein